MKYELRAIIFEYDNRQMWSTKRSKLLEKYDTKIEAEKALKRANIGHYRGKYIYQYIDTLQNANEVSKKLDEYLKSQLGIHHEIWEINFQIPELSENHLENIKNIVGIDFCLVEKGLDKGRYIIDWCKGMGEEEFWGADEIEYDTHESATDYAIVMVTKWFLNLNGYQPDSFSAPEINGTLIDISKNAVGLTEFLRRSKYFYYENKFIKIINEIKQLERMRFSDLLQEEIPIIDFEPNVKNECKELIGLLKKPVFSIKEV